MEYSRTRPLGSHTSRLVVPSFLPVIRSSFGDTATASLTTGSPIEKRCSAPSYLSSADSPVATVTTCCAPLTTCCAGTGRPTTDTSKATNPRHRAQRQATRQRTLLRESCELKECPLCQNLVRRRTPPLYASITMAGAGGAPRRSAAALRPPDESPRDLRSSEAALAPAGRSRRRQSPHRP